MRTSSWNMRTRAPGMAADLLGTHRILLALLEIKETITRDIESRDSFKKTAKLLLKASGQKLLHCLEEPMDEHSKHDRKESVRRTIMEHDKVFRQQVHELHRLYHVQKSLMTEVGCGKHFQSRTEESQQIVQRSRSNHNRSPSTSETNQSACLGNAQHSATPQVPEHLGLQECKPRTCLSLFSEENSATKEGNRTENPVGSHKAVEDGNCSASVESDLDLKLSIGPSSPATKGPHWLFSGSRERNPSGQHR
ncbi:hypothetical protein SETIT_4G248500v2 [Setaria italica]|uniref:Uncharacterized protein n=2 Tax=Setaria italica TaxID=4555 RepID=K3XYZ5_SETIT|nr:uncharacterized protein LOC101777856 [Setaria italica]RCV22787.1 hypothetical protein SETIT_4G248500v2 [Setaria italica]